jgi:dTDP-4-dehydrorhamnose reductase
MRYLIAGASGMLGRDLQVVLADRDVTAVDHAEVDVTDLDAVRAASAGHDVIINAAAYTNVDDAEKHEEAAYAVNATGAANLAIVASESGARLLQLSTDYVFDGNAATPYGEDAPVNPISAYGRTKAEGERLVQQLNPERTLVVRTAWLYGRHGQNFATTMLRLASEREELSVVTDQVGQPTWTLDLAHQLVALLDGGVRSGIFHGTNSGEASWYDFARAIFGAAGLDPDRVRPADSSQFVRPAPRPSYSVLGHGAWDRTGIPAMRDWRAALNAAAHQGVLEKQ